MNEQKEPSAARTERLANEGDCKSPHRVKSACWGLTLHAISL